MSKAQAKERLKYWFEKFEIGDWWNKKIQELSKGMAQKIQFIVTVLHQPKLLIFDEPFSGFDPINANRIKDEILQLRDEGVTVPWIAPDQRSDGIGCQPPNLFWSRQKRHQLSISRDSCAQ